MKTTSRTTKKRLFKMKRKSAFFLWSLFAREKRHTCERERVVCARVCREEKLDSRDAARNRRQKRRKNRHRRRDTRRRRL